MKLNADTNRVLMSDVLKDRLPQLEDDVLEPIQGKHVLAVGHMVSGNETKGVTGILRGVIFGAVPEVEFRLDLEDALGIVQAPQLQFSKFELHHGDKVIDMPGPFVVSMCRIDDISAQDQLCTIWLQLKRQAR